jgi:hypothetical protein
VLYLPSGDPCTALEELEDELVLDTSLQKRESNCTTSWNINVSFIQSIEHRLDVSELREQIAVSENPAISPHQNAAVF